MMKNFRIVFSVFLLCFVFSCVVTSEKYRFQKRMDAFYNLLGEEEIKYFRQADFQSAGEAIKKKLGEDTNFYKKWKELQYAEAIATFDPDQTVGYFYRVILKELNRSQYYIFLEMLNKDLQMAFVKREKFVQLLDELGDKKLQNFLNNLKTEYRLKDFSNEEIYNFFRNILFREATGKHFYDFCKFLNSLNLLKDFEDGKIDKLKDIELSASDKIEFERIKKLTGLTKLNFYELVSVYYDYVIKEMDQGAVIQTLYKF